MNFTEQFKKTANLEVTTVIGCPVMCSFCPQTSLIKNFKAQNSFDYNNKVLTFDKYQKIIDKIPNWVDIHFSGMSEPYASKDCSKMISYTLEKGHKFCLYSTLVGANKDDIDLLTQINFDSKYKLVVHLPDDEQNFKAKITDVYIDNLKYFLNNSNIQQKILDGSIDFMSMSRRGFTDPVIKDLVPKKLSSFIAISRAGNLSNDNEKFEGKQITKRKNGKIICSVAPYLNHNVLLPNGDVVLCCMDYSVQHKIGNLLEQSYESLFNNDSIAQIFKQLNEDDNTNKLLCRNCELAKELK